MPLYSMNRAKPRQIFYAEEPEAEWGVGRARNEATLSSVDSAQIFTLEGVMLGVFAAHWPGWS